MSPKNRRDGNVRIIVEPETKPEAELTSVPVRDGELVRRREPNLRPRYTADLRELWLRDQLVKKFTGPADCQERILGDFERRGWPDKIENPLRGRKRKERLKDAKRRLNGHQHPRQVIRFRILCHGTVIRWELIRKSSDTWVSPE